MALFAGAAQGQTRGDAENGRGGEVVDQCIATHGTGQVMRVEGRYVEAREALLRCALPDCPHEVREDCARWVAELADATPSVVFAVRVGGVDRSDVRVLIDGATRLERLDGRPLDIDPGDHTFRFQLPSGVATEVRASIRTGERNRIIAVTFPPSRPATKSRDGKAEGFRFRVPVPAMALGAVAAVAGISSAALHSGARIDYERARRECEPFCSEDRQDRIRYKAVGGDVLLAVAFTATLGATVIWMVQSSRQRRTAVRRSAPGSRAWGGRF